VFGCDNGTVYNLQGSNGVLKTSYSCGGGVMVRSTCAIANIDTVNFSHTVKGDLSEAIFGGTDGNLYAVSFAQGGQLVPGWPLSLSGVFPILSSPALTDINHDPDMEILVGASDGCLHMVHAPKNPSLIPGVDFSGSPLSGTPPLTVSFTDLSTNTPISWLWQFGDGATTTTQNVSHTYSDPGNYTVRLAATNAHGTGSTIKTDYITVHPVPVAGFTHSPVSGNVPLTVNFTNLSQYSPSSWSWDFGDTGASALPNPSHSYTQPGLYTVTLTVSNAHGSDIITKTDCVLVMALMPQADFTQDITYGKAPLLINFTDLSMGNPTSWSWSFGDGGTSPLKHPSHTYAKPGIYLVSLTASNSSGSDTKTNPVYINVEPQTVSVLIPNVPDYNQPPTQTLGSTVINNFCAPMAATNISKYWDYVIKDPNALGVNANLPGETAAEYVGYFMDTNNAGSADRGNGSDSHSGTYTKDIFPGLFEFARWDQDNKFDIPPASPPTLPILKCGYDWEIDTFYNPSFDSYTTEIDEGKPPILVFRFWNPVALGTIVTNVSTGEEIEVYKWGAQISNSTSGDPQNPEEQWNLLDGDLGIGHAVTGIGYIPSWDPDGAGPEPESEFAIVHDNWDTTPEHVAIPWNNATALIPSRITLPVLAVRGPWNLYE